ncbi:substrate-binding domain-containing protein [Pseudomonas nicosulfuronedens]|uniref:Sugar ABC transporter substrate-binding protein n=1 Tax=Pseudomonas nicosulfuronedens TaxID=2571105 RepID=A0A5R9QM42_9PSED|nr:substrate-binding domain-containing protein [Pseudomonas nicosulfuronedens]MDH1013053.1 substrate-binding domain-containing protein [Pseudomonas nicosulfuronedens]MDH1983160.1 substrate-binding domain-containing protein [Pseudomonas nicosulfuronedens]MDH2030803.1 substrate-binding domain-containing protein [Pseudomonas nicosulfuronedens]TLX69873.1 sugar ABC transporter substrate-binding protein [Pseudomonas nicosulfuronedens]
MKFTPAKSLRALFAAGLLLSGATSALAAGLPGAPAPFDKGGVQIALVGYLFSGDFPEAYLRGVEKQADALDVKLRVFDARQQAATQREMLEQAIDLGVDGIIVQLGLAETLKDSIDKALAKGIKVVTFDVDVNDPRITRVEQDHRELARLALKQVLQDNGNAFEAGYVYIDGFTPMERRDEIWRQVKAENPGIVEKARFGTLNAPIANSVADQASAVLRANPGISVFFAPFDEFAKGVKIAVDEAGLGKQVKIYSADISTADIQIMKEEGSAWSATAAVNPEVAGAISVRSLALRIAGENPGEQVLVPPTLITRQQLLDLDVKNVRDLARKVPAFGEAQKVAQAPWIPLAN